MSRGPGIVERARALDSDRVWVKQYLRVMLRGLFSLSEPRFLNRIVTRMLDILIHGNRILSYHENRILWLICAPPVHTLPMWLEWKENNTNSISRDGLWLVLAKQAHGNPPATVIGSGPRSKPSNVGHSPGPVASVWNWRVTQFRPVIQEVFFFFLRSSGKELLLFFFSRKQKAEIFSLSLEVVVHNWEAWNCCIHIC